MKLALWLATTILLVGAVAVPKAQAPTIEPVVESAVLPIAPAGNVAGAAIENTPNEAVPEATVPTAAFGLPISDALSRVTKKPFDIYITPETSPVQNDRFTGYHVGTDFETTADEKDVEIPILAICDGPLVLKEYAKGYGGVAVQACVLNGENITVVYGHLALESITPVAGEQLTRGETIGRLGQGYSDETDGVRKHLHLGVHKGSALDIRGYVPSQAQAEAWLDVRDYLQLQ